MTERKIRKLLLAALPIETDRLTLRYITADDAYDMYEYASIPEVSQYLLWHPHINLAATEGYIEALQKRYLRGLYADWAVVLKKTGKMIGTCGFAALDNTHKTCEIGYVLSPLYRGCGYMTEAVQAVLDLTFRSLKLEKAVLRIISENRPSLDLAERLHFRPEYRTNMIIKDIEREVIYYVLMNTEYKK